MHLKNTFLFGLLAIILLGGTISPVLSQSSPDSNLVVINEVEINPLNGSEYVELYNPTSHSIDISGWSLTPSMTWKEYEIVPNTIIESKSFATFTYHSSWFKDFGDTISLTNISGDLIDQTPILIDLDNDAKSWQRYADGIDTDSMPDWKLKTMTPNSSNGKIVGVEEEIIFSFTGKTDKTEYTFGETLTISGSVTENLFSDRFQSVPESISIKIQGPNNSEVQYLYPDRDLSFSTQFNIKKTHGFDLGTYNVEISYGENLIQTNFVVTEELTSSSTKITSDIVNIFTDKESYIPGETAILFADTSSSLEYAGLEYTVLDPNGNKYAHGTIFPNSQFSTVHKSGGGEIYPFSTQFLMSGVNPVYGIYQIHGTYTEQNPSYGSDVVEIDASTTFQLIEDVKDDVIISLFTDKEIYEVGDIVKITGRSNEIWTEDLELQISQTGVFESDSRYQAFAPFTEKYSVKLNGDGTFEYNFKIPSHTQTNLSYGDYLIKVSEYFGQNSKTIKIVEDTESFVDIRTPLGLQMDKSEYVLGTAATIYGKILNYQKNDNTYNYGNKITITFTDSSGNSLMSEDRIKNTNDYGKSPNEKLIFYAMPDEVGNFKISMIFHLLQFDIGKYTVTADHYSSKTTESLEFEIITAQSELLPTTEIEEPLSFEICSSTRNDISEIIKDLKQIGKGEIPPSMESIDCDGTTDFVTGEKLVIRGQVVLKQVTSLDSSSITQDASSHSYSTNYAQSEVNYVELSIPYPQTLTVSTSYRTIPDEGENYHGGGGEGSQCREGASFTVWTTNPTTGERTSAPSSSHCEEGAITKGGAKDSERHTGYDGQAILREVTKNLTDMRVKAYPDAEGNFVAVFDLRAGIFVDGIYKLKGSYFGYKSEQSFLVDDTSLKGGLEPEVVVTFDKTEYVPGEVVFISGKIKNVYYFDPVAVEIKSPADASKINCLTGQSCGSENAAKRIRVSEGTEGAMFFMNYKIPINAPLGKYTVTADTHFGITEKPFFVISESDIISSIPSEQPITTKIIEKFNRISDNEIPITLDEKDVAESTLYPRVIQGSLFTSARGDESKINLEITTLDGQCVIGQNSNCLVSESTRKPGAIYSIVSIDDINYKIRYSGNDVRLEKFSIVPEDSDSKINIDNWNVKIIKDDQPTRFYYKVSYIALE